MNINELAKEVHENAVNHGSVSYTHLPQQNREWKS